MLVYSYVAKIDTVCGVIVMAGCKLDAGRTAKISDVIQIFVASKIIMFGIFLIYWL